MSLSILRWINQRVAAYKTLAIALTAMLGLGIGLWLHHLSQPPAKPPTVNQLIRALQKQDTVLHNAWQDIWTCLPDWVKKRWPGGLPQSAAQTRRSAALELVDFGPRAQPAVPFLVKALARWQIDRDTRAAIGRLLATLRRDELPIQIRCLTIECLLRLGPEAVPAISTTLAHPDSPVRFAAVQALSQIGPPARNAVPQLTALAYLDQKYAIRTAAAAAVKVIEPGPLP